jgi:GNAT superfamily N-acetyltransferase
MTGMDGIRIGVNEPVDTADIIAVFVSSGIRRPVDDPERIARMFAHADLVVSAWDGGRLVGVARALTDFSYCCYLSDIAVMKEYQRRGIGAAMIDLVRERIGEETMLLLLSAPGAMTYYPQLGFQPVENGFIIPRRR